VDLGWCLEPPCIEQISVCTVVQLYSFAGVLECDKSIMLKKIQNRSGASPQPCFVPFDTPNSGERSPFSITDALIPSWNDRMMSTRASGQPILLRIAHRPGRCTESNALERSIKTAYRSCLCSVHFSCSCRNVKVMSAVPRPDRNPHWLSGRMPSSSTYRISLFPGSCQK